MSPRRSSARAAMLASASALIRERGAAATSLDDVLAHSGAPRGSIYHHFPGGRAQLLQEAVGASASFAADLLRQSGDATPLQLFDAFIAMWRESLMQSDFRAGCPVLAVAIEHDSEAPQLREAAAEAFGSWHDALASHMRAHGTSPAHARRLSTLIIASVEGAVVLCRAQRSIQPLDDVARELRVVLQAA